MYILIYVILYVYILYTHTKMNPVMNHSNVRAKL